MMDPETQKKYEALKAILADMGGLVLGYSGGVDSTLLLKVVADGLGNKALAVIGYSESLPKREADSAIEVAEWMGARYRTIHTEELQKEGYASNPSDRCFFCKDELFGRLVEIAREEGLPWVVDGSNYDDLGDHRPGRRAARQLGVRSPLQEAKLTKAEIREISRELGLPTADKPSLACLASRIPYGQRVTAEKLAMIEEAENFLWAQGLPQLRVRHHEGNLARIEIPEDYISRFLDPDFRQQVVKKFKEIGYTFVSLDLQGFRSGSGNELLKITATRSTESE